MMPSGPGPRFPRVEEPLAQQRWKIHVSSFCFSSSGHLSGPEKMELVAPQTGSVMADVDAVLVAPGLDWGPGNTLDIPVDIRSGNCSDNHSVRLVHLGTVLSA